MLSQFAAATRKSMLLSSSGSDPDAARWTAEADSLAARLGTPWDEMADGARKAHDAAMQIEHDAAGLTGRAAVEAHRQSLALLAETTSWYPYLSQYWSDQLKVLLELQQVMDSSAFQANSREREEVLSDALTAAWLAKVVSTESAAPEAHSRVCDARRNLTWFLISSERFGDARPMAEQNVRDGEEFVRLSNGAPKALEFVADANVAVALVRHGAKDGGWEEPFRKAFGYGERLAENDGRTSKRQYWLGRWRRVLALYLDRSGREDAAKVEYLRAVDACQGALALAKGDAADAEGARACLGELAVAGYPAEPSSNP
jgi:hypothetical protein